MTIPEICDLFIIQGSVDGDDNSSISSKDQRGSITSITQGQREGSLSEGRSLMSSGDDDEDEEPDPTQIALPTLLMAGTIFGSIFRADLSKNKVDVETNNLRKYLFHCVFILLNMNF